MSLVRQDPEAAVADHEQVVRQALEDAEIAIRHHPAVVVELYEEEMRLFEKWAEQALSGDPRALLAARYCYAMSFISGWYHVHGDRANRDKSAQSAASVVGLVGAAPLVAFRDLVAYEQMWRRRFRKAGIGNSRPFGRILLGILILAAAVFMVMKVFNG
jgi:hypothetical protein